MGPHGMMKLFSALSVNTDEALMLRVKTGDQDAFTLLYSKYRDKILTFICHSVASDALGADLTQDVFIKVYEARHHYEPKAKFTTWLYTIAKRVVIDEYRKKNPAAPMTKAQHEDEESMLENELASNEPSAEDLLLRQADRGSVERCFRKLPVFQREALLLRADAELSYDEIAETLQCTLAAVKTALHRGKLALAACLATSLGGPRS